METTRLCWLFLVIGLLGTLFRHVSASQLTPVGPQKEYTAEEAAHAAGQSEGTAPTVREEAEETVQKASEEGSARSDNEAVGEKDDTKAAREKMFPLGHRIEVQVHHGSYIVERDRMTPHVLTISLQLLNGEKHVLGFVPMAEVTAMLDEAKSLGSGLSQALLDTKFLSYAFEPEEPAGKLNPPDALETTKLAEQFLRAEAEADEQQDRKKRDEDEEDGENEEDDDEEGEDVEEEEDEVEEKGAQRSKQVALRGSKD